MKHSPLIMKKKYFLFLFLILFAGSSAAIAQGFGLPPGFDLKTFQKNEEQALWYLKYDSTWQAVVNFDHITGSKDYICYRDKRGWKVVAGTVDSSGFKSDAAFYQLDGKSKVTKANKKFDTLLVAAMGRALYNANMALAKLNIKSAAGWRKFVRTNTDQTIVVQAFCDADASGTIWYGPECAWYFSPNGRKLSTSKIINKTPMMAGKNGEIINLSCPADKMPSIGTIWLAHKYKGTYTEINVKYKTGTSTLRYNAAEKTYSWEHAAN